MHLQGKVYGTCSKFQDDPVTSVTTTDFNPNETDKYGNFKILGSCDRSAAPGEGVLKNSGEFFGSI